MKKKRTPCLVLVPSSKCKCSKCTSERAFWAAFERAYYEARGMVPPP